MFLQFLISGILTGSSYIPVACGLTLIYSTTGVFYFAHGMSYVVAGYLAYWFVKILHINLLLSIFMALLITGLFGMACWKLVFSPLQKSKMSPIGLIIASIALLILIQNLWFLLNNWIGNNDRVFLQYDLIDRSIEAFDPVIITGAQVIIIPISLIALLGVVLFLKYTQIGCSMRAVSSHRLLAAEQGLRLDWIDLFTFAIGTMLAGVSACMDLLDTSVGIDAIRGVRITLFSSVACLIGGAHSLPATALSCVILGVIRSLSIWKLTGNWEEAITATLLIGFMSVRSLGISGRKLWKEAA